VISVCMPTYNGGKFIFKQLNSIISQLSEDDEIIISDDSSTDDTIGIIKSFNDKRIRLFEENKFKSPVLNLENALKHAKHDFIFLADQDDIWEANKVKVLMEKLNTYDLVLSNCKLIDENDHIIQPNYWRYYFKKDKPSLSFIQNLKKNPFLGCAMAFNRRVLNRVLPFPKRIAMHDIWIGLLSELSFKVYFTEKILFSWRRHGSNVTFSIDRPEGKLSTNSLFYKLKYRIAILYYLFKRIVLNK
jgi:glycosyltransferase involved in cell wall biosynthesis